MQLHVREYSLLLLLALLLFSVQVPLTKLAYKFNTEHMLLRTNSQTNGDILRHIDETKVPRRVDVEEKSGWREIISP